VGVFAALGWWSQRMTPVLGGAERLAACGPAPNCVCSEGGAAGDGHTIAPLPRPAGEDPLAAAAAAIIDLGGVVRARDGTYLHATFTSRLFRFVDDLEVRVTDGALAVRSASRVGHSDLGANRARVEALRARLSAR